MTTTTLPPRPVGSVSDVTLPFVTAIETLWSAIRAQHPDVPPVVVTLGASAPGERGRLGHFAAGPWQAGDVPTVLRIDGHGLQRDEGDAEDMLATLLHAAVHGVARTRDVLETSRQGRYHNRVFGKLAEELGLTVESDATAGWAPTGLAEGTAAAYCLAELATALADYQPIETLPTTDRNRTSGNGVAAVCSCPKPRRIRVRSREQFETAPITCGACGQPFTVIPDEAANQI